MAKLARCRYCQAPVEFFASPFTGKPRKFEAKVLDGHHPHAIKAFPVMGRRAYKFIELVAVIQVQRETSQEAAEAEVRDMAWYVAHDCPNTPFTSEVREERTR